MRRRRDGFGRGHRGGFLSTGFWEARTGLAGRVGVIVGGGGGLGRACALDLAGAGMRLALCDKDPEALGDTEATITEGGGEVVTGELDARDPEALGEFFERVHGTLGPSWHVLVNVVGGTFRQPFAESKPRGWEALIRANFTWLLHSTQLAIPRLRAAGGASIVNLTSIEGHRAAPNFAVYAAMKAAVTSLTRTLAVELAPEQIRVNTIAPDYVPTAGLAPQMAPPSAQLDLAHSIGIPMAREGTFEDVGGCALFLASDLSCFVTGQSLHPDGGAMASAGWFNWPDTGFSNQPPSRALRSYLDDEPTS